jgi:hypothetical protein
MTEPAGGDGCRFFAWLVRMQPDRRIQEAGNLSKSLAFPDR